MMIAEAICLQELPSEISLMSRMRLIPLRIGAGVGSDITRFFPRIDQIFPGEALIPFFGAQDEGFSEFRST